MSNIIKERRGAEPAKPVARGRGPVKLPPASDRFLPLTKLWEEGAVSDRNPLQEQAAEFQRRQEELLAQARQEAERIRKQAYDEGHAQGEQEGRRAGQEKYEQTVRQLDAVLAALDREIGARNERHEEEILLLIKTMVDRLVHHETSTNERVIRACLQEALQYVAQKSRIQVHLHADDFERLREASLEDPSLLGGKDHLELVEDPTVAAGGCFLETDFGEVDATLENCRQKLYETVDAIFRNLAAPEGR